MQSVNITFPILRKRDGRLTKFDRNKITEAIHKAFFATGKESKIQAEHLCDLVVEELSKTHAGSVPQVEEIQDIVEKVLIKEGYLATAKAYILYRAKRTSIREGKSELMDTMEEIFKETNQEIPFHFLSPSAKMLKVASAASCNFYLSRIIPSQYADAHRKGEINIHSLEYYGKTSDSLQIPLYKLLTKGFSTGYGFLRPPKRYSSLAAQAAIILQSCQNDMFGGQAFYDFDGEMGRFTDEHLHENEEQCFQAIEGLVYNLNMMYSRVGAQVPLSTISVGLDTTKSGRLVTKHLLEMLKRGLGRGETPIFPEVIFCLKEGVNYDPGDPNYDLFKLAIEVSSRRMNPNFAFMDAPFNKSAQVAYWGDGSRIEGNRVGDSSPLGRGNIASVVINLPRIALWMAHKRADFKMDSFYSELFRIINLSAQQILNRLEMLNHLKRKELPFIMGQGVYMGSESLADNDEIKMALRNGTLSIGFMGLAETLFILQGRHHGQDPDVTKLGLEIVEYMRGRISEIAEEHNLNFVLSAPTSGRIAGEFIISDRQEFGIVPDVTDKSYYTNSFHVPAGHKISMEDHLKIEAPYHKLCNGGHFTFVSASAPPSPETMESVIIAMKEAGIGYGGMSFPLDECLECGTLLVEGEKCGQCGGTQVKKLRRASSHLSPLEHLGEAFEKERLDRLGNENL